MRMQRSLRPKPDLNGLRTALHAKVLRHDAAYGLSTLFFGDGELRVPLVRGTRRRRGAGDDRCARCVDRIVAADGRVDHQPSSGNDRCYRAARVALCARDVSILAPRSLDALVTTESIERLGLESGLRAWAMIKTVAIGKDAVRAADIPTASALARAFVRRIERSRRARQSLARWQSGSAVPSNGRARPGARRRRSIPRRRPRRPG